MNVNIYILYRTSSFYKNLGWTSHQTHYRSYRDCRVFTFHSLQHWHYRIDCVVDDDDGDDVTTMLTMMVMIIIIAQTCMRYTMQCQESLPKLAQFFKSDMVLTQHLTQHLWIYPFDICCCINFTVYLFQYIRWCADIFTCLCVCNLYAGTDE